MQPERNRAQIIGIYRGVRPPDLCICIKEILLVGVVILLALFANYVVTINLQLYLTPHVQQKEHEQQSDNED
jgi:hypothetical protein